MEDQSLYTKNQPKEISEGLQHFIDSMVEEIVLEGKPFDTQKKYLHKFSEKERLNYKQIEADITSFINVLNSLRTALSDAHGEAQHVRHEEGVLPHQNHSLDDNGGQEYPPEVLALVKLAEEKGRECHVSESTIKKLVEFSSQPKSLKKKKCIWDWIIGTRRFSSKQEIVLYCVIGLAAIGLFFFCRSSFLKSQRDTLVEKDTVLKVLHDTIVVMQYSTEAEQMYREKAEQGDKDAQFQLARHYDTGTRGLVQNYAEAVKWYRLSANQGYPKAQNNLGACYEDGQGVPRNLQEAKKWYKKAADQGNSRAKANLERLEDVLRLPEKQEKVPHKINSHNRKY